jgi:geranylgeranyl diphosphate synthase type II
MELWLASVREQLRSKKFDQAPDYLASPMQYALNGEGKILRPVLCLASTDAVGGNWEEALQVAVALEIFHTFTLVHDDIMDGDDLRRGRPTVHKKFDMESALLAGDTLLLHVYQLLGKSDPDIFSAVYETFTSGAMEVCHGQGWDMQFEKSHTVNPDQYEMMIDLKTGALIKMACALGAIIGGGSNEQIAALSRFGLLLGRAFQMQDDLLEVSSTVDKMGKSLGSDVLNEKKTWIWLDLKQHLSDFEKDQWEKIRLTGEMTVENRDQVHQWMVNHGTIARAEVKIQTWIQEADQILSDFNFTEKSMLARIADRILKRKN